MASQPALAAVDHNILTTATDQCGSGNAANNGIAPDGPMDIDDPDDEACEVCRSDQYADDDLIIFCDRCNLPVHQVRLTAVSLLADHALCLPVVLRCAGDT